MTITIGLVANVYQECNALPGWIETHLSFFDDVRVFHSGPNGARSEDGTIEILKNWGIPVEFGSIDGGFGITRTAAIRSSPCDWVMLLDADERFFPVHRIMRCSGDGTPQGEVDAILQTYDFSNLQTAPPNWSNVARLGENLRVDISEAYNQGARLREILASDEYDAVATVRRHWHDFSFRRPTQNWQIVPDWQMRIIRNHPSIYFDPHTRMHEHLIGANRVFRADMERGPFFEHMHFTFKKMEVGQRAHDIAIYDRIHAGEKPPTWEQFKRK